MADTRNSASESRIQSEVDVDGIQQERIRAKIREGLEGLRGQDLTKAEVQSEVQRLLAHGEVAIPLILEQFKDEDETLLAVATQTLKAWGEPKPVKQLLALLRDPEVGALAKALILNILGKYGLDVDAPELLGLSIDLENYRVESSDGEGNGARDS